MFAADYQDVRQTSALMVKDDIRGLEFDWYACDQVGHLALLASAGSALVPAAILEATGDRDRLDEHFRVARQLRSEWEQFAEIGLFVYDCGSPHAEGYRRVAVPANALRYRDLPGDLTQAAAVFCFSGLSFTDTVTIDGALVDRT